MFDGRGLLRKGIPWHADQDSAGGPRINEHDIRLPAAKSALCSTKIMHLLYRSMGTDIQEARSTTKTVVPFARSLASVTELPVGV